MAAYTHRHSQMNAYFQLRVSGRRFPCNNLDKEARFFTISTFLACFLVTNVLCCHSSSLNICKRKCLPPTVIDELQAVQKAVFLRVTYGVFVVVALLME